MNTDLQTIDTAGFKLMSRDDKNIFLSEMQKFTATLNTSPVKFAEESINGKVIKYIPISVVEKDLDRLYFGMVQYEILWSKQVLNEFEVAARIKVFHPVMMQWMTYDGIGAALIQQTANTPVIEFHQHKLQTALKLAAPNAYAEAIKNAAKKIGKRFGADLMRKIEDDYKPFNISNPSAHKVVPNKDEVITPEMDSPELIATLKTKKALVKAYNDQLLSGDKYNELLKAMLNKPQMP